MRDFNLVVPYETFTYPVPLTRTQRVRIRLGRLVGRDLTPPPVVRDTRVAAQIRGEQRAIELGARGELMEWWNIGPNFIQGRCPWPETSALPQAPS